MAGRRFMFQAQAMGMGETKDAGIERAAEGIVEGCKWEAAIRMKSGKSEPLGLKPDGFCWLCAGTIVSANHRSPPARKPVSPKGWDWLLLEDGLGSALIGEADGGEVGLDCGVVGYGDGTAAAGGAVGSVAAIGSVAAAHSWGRSTAAGTSTAAAAAFAARAPGSAVGVDGERAALRVDQVIAVVAGGGDMGLKQRMGPSAKGHGDLDGRRVAAVSAIPAVGPIAAIAAVAARRGVIGVGGTVAFTITLPVGSPELSAAPK